MVIRKLLKNRKAQEMSISTLVILVLAIIVLVVVVLGFWKGWDYIFGKIGILPSNLEAAAQSCDVSAKGNLETSYCYEFKQVTISGTKKYVNCAELANVAVFTKLSKACDPIRVSDMSADLCKTLTKDTYINNNFCNSTSHELQAPIVIVP